MVTYLELVFISPRYISLPYSGFSSLSFVKYFGVLFVPVYSIKPSPFCISICFSFSFPKSELLGVFGFLVLDRVGVFIAGISKPVELSIVDSEESKRTELLGRSICENKFNDTKTNTTGRNLFNIIINFQKRITTITPKIVLKFLLNTFCLWLILSFSTPNEH